MASLHFRPDIEGMRAVGILLVVAYHVGIPGFPGGYIGVDVFFVVSGYLITTLLLRELEDTGTIDLLAFYARRARRLLPAAILTMAVAGTVAFFLYSPIEQLPLARTFAWTSLYASNVHFARAAVKYLGGDASTNPLLHTWSLAVEEQFYVVWPVFVLVGIGAVTARKRFGGLVLLGVVAFASFGLSLYLTGTRQPWAFFLSTSRAWEFALGGIGAVLGPMTASRAHDATREALGWIGLIGILVAALSIDQSTAFPGMVALLPTVGTLLVLMGGTGTRVARLLSLGPFQELGRLSYSWYLWHWPVLVLAAAAGLAASAGTRTTLALVALLLAKVSYHLIENPIRRAPALLRRAPIYSILLAAVLTLGAATASLVWKYSAARAASSPAQQALESARHDLPSIYGIEGCDTYFRSATVIDCAVGPAAGTAATVVLIGDSHAGQWFPALEAIARRRNWRLVVMTKSSCPVISIPVFLGSLRREYTECTLWRDSALRQIEVLKPSVVIASSSIGYRAAHSRLALNDDEWREGTAMMFGVLSRASGHVILLRDTPLPGFDVPICLARKAWRSRALPRKPCEFAPDDARKAEIYRQQQQAVASYKNVTTVDLSRAICPQIPCQPERDGFVLYRDSGHLSATFAASLAPTLDREIDSLLR